MAGKHSTACTVKDTLKQAGAHTASFLKPQPETIPHASGSSFTSTGDSKVKGLARPLVQSHSSYVHYKKMRHKYKTYREFGATNEEIEAEAKLAHKKPATMPVEQRMNP